MMKYSALPALLIACITFSCTHQPRGSLSFYYWKTNFSLTGREVEALKNNGVENLYIRYFDVDKQNGQPQPVSVVTLDSSVKRYRVIPVVYIKNKVFEKTNAAGVASLANNIFSLVTQINRSQQTGTDEIQFDCDWTESTRQAYFDFIETYRKMAPQTISATIRLHQVKYHQRTGIPPVDYGVLMYYNMGQINAGMQNSIYDRAIAGRYNAYIKAYPLTLDIALPLFTWGQQIRDGQVVQLLNKISLSHFQNDSNFTILNPQRLVAKHACFKAGYYFRENDMVKIESVTGTDLLDMARDIRRYSGQRTKNLIFYDLDSINLVRYDKDTFKKVMDNIH